MVYFSYYPFNHVIRSGLQKLDIHSKPAHNFFLHKWKQPHIDDFTRTESTTVMIKLHTAMEMKPVRSNRLLPALSIRKNWRGKNNTLVLKCNTIPFVVHAVKPFMKK